MSGSKKALLAGLMILVAAGTYVLLLRLDPLKSNNPSPDAHQPIRRPQPAPPLPHPPPKPPPEANTEEESPTDAEQVEDPPLPELRTPRRRPAAVLQKQPSQEEKPTKVVMAIKDTTPPPLEILQPKDRSLARRSPIPIRVQAEAGGRVLVDGRDLIEKAGGFFTGRLALARGSNRIRVVAMDAVGNRTALELRLTYIDPGLEKSKERIGALIAKLTDVKRMVRDLDKQSAELVARIDSSDDVDVINALSKELRSLRNSRNELEKAVDKVMDDLDKLSR